MTTLRDADYGGRVGFRYVEINDAEWTPLVTEFACDYFVVRNLKHGLLFGNQTVLLRTDPNDENTEIDLPPSTQDGVTSAASSLHQYPGGFRFSSEQAVFWAKSTNGVYDVTLVMIR